MFITFEGPEGSGKSTQIRLLAAWLREQGREVVLTREPGGTAIGDQIRGVLHDVDNTAMSASAEILLYSASRAQIVSELIRPALAAGKLVLCDRFFDSTYAYQGYGRGLDMRELRMITEFATGGLAPDLTLMLDIDVERGIARRVDNDEEMNRLDLEAIEFHQRVRQGYLDLIKAAPDRWQVVDADRPIELIQAELRQRLSAILE
ncbi:MAG: dTMP kinase [Candidatus Promineifilaceae bacterium]